MAFIAACTDKGAKRSVNQDACCVEVAQTSFGEVIMAIVCDGVGGLSAGELASATVAHRFRQWFREELPTLLTGMNTSAPLDFGRIQVVWGVLLKKLNEAIQVYGRVRSEKLGTTFSGILICGGSYLVGHVGDSRVYQLGARGQRQITEDQTPLAKKTASGEVALQDVRSSKRGHVILQSVGTEALLKPVFYRGTCSPTDLFVLCCDGAYRKAEDEGMYSFFEGIDHTDEGALQRACENVLKYDLAHGEKDNLTIVCVSADTGNLDVSAGKWGVRVQDADVSFEQYATANPNEYDDSLTMLQDTDEDDDLPTMVESQDEDFDDIPTMVEVEDGDAEEDLPTIVAPQDVAEEDLPTIVAPQDDDAEEDLPTMVEGDES
jgi:serine/threonine protein phosphatase PrpC